MTTIADIMTRSIATVRRDETLQAAAQRMHEMDVGSLPVVDGRGSSTSRRSPAASPTATSPSAAWPLA